MDIAIGEDEFPLILLYDDMKVMYSKSMKCLFCRIHLLWRPGPLMTWTLTPEFWNPELWRLVAFTASNLRGPFDAPDYWPREAFMPFDAPGLLRPKTPMWHLTPQYPWVAFDAPIPPGGIWRPKPLGGIWRPNNLKWHLTPRTIFQIFQISFFFQNFLIPTLRIPLGSMWSFRSFAKPSLDPRNLVSFLCSARAAQKNIYNFSEYFPSRYPFTVL